MWGNTYPSNLNELCSLPNKCIRCMFFTDSIELSKVFYNLSIFLNLITLLNWEHAHSHLRYLTSLPVIPHCFMILSEQSLTWYTSKGNFHRPKVRTNSGKFTFVYVASKLWETVPTNLKRLSTSSFEKRYENRLLKCQS